MLELKIFIYFYSFPIDIPVEHLERFYEGKLEVTRKFAYGMKLVQAELDKVMKEIEADKSSGVCCINRH